MGFECGFEFGFDEGLMGFDWGSKGFEFGLMLGLSWVRWGSMSGLLTTSSNLSNLSNPSQTP